MLGLYSANGVRTFFDMYYVHTYYVATRDIALPPGMRSGRAGTSLLASG